MRVDRSFEHRGKRILWHVRNETIERGDRYPIRIAVTDRTASSIVVESILEYSNVCVTVHVNGLWPSFEE
jgi:hypothetical protein